MLFSLGEVANYDPIYQIFSNILAKEHTLYTSSSLMLGLTRKKPCTKLQTINDVSRDCGLT